MKLTLKSTVALVAFGSLVALSPLTLAQEKKAESTDAKPKPQQPAQRPDRLAQMAEQLQLTEDQKTQLKPILKEETDKMRALRADTSLSREDRQAKLKEIRDGTSAKFKKILKPEQYEKWQKAMAQRGQRRPQGGQPPAPPATPPATQK